MTDFDYRRPASLAEATELLGRADAMALAGGTDLLVAIRHRQARPTLVVDLKSVSDIGAGIETIDDRLRIGGKVVMSQLSTDPHVRSHFPALAAAASVVGSIQIRNRATLAGNLCNASPAADTAPPLLAYSASVTVSGPGGDRSIPIEELFVGPGATVLRAGDVMTAVEIPIPATGTGSSFARVTRRRGVDLASVSLACVVEPTGKVTFGFGAVAPTPVVATTTLEALEEDDGWSRLLSVTSPISDVRAGAEYRRGMLEVHSHRALQEAVARLGGR